MEIQNKKKVLTNHEKKNLMKNFKNLFMNTKNIKNINIMKNRKKSCKNINDDKSPRNNFKSCSKSTEKSPFINKKSKIPVYKFKYSFNYPDFSHTKSSSINSKNGLRFNLLNKYKYHEKFKNSKNNNNFSKDQLLSLYIMDDSKLSKNNTNKSNRKFVNDFSNLSKKKNKTLKDINENKNGKIFNSTKLSLHNYKLLDNFGKSNKKKKKKKSKKSTSIKRFMKSNKTFYLYKNLKIKSGKNSKVFNNLKKISKKSEKNSKIIDNNKNDFKFHYRNCSLENFLNLKHKNKFKQNKLTLVYEKKIHNNTILKTIYYKKKIFSIAKEKKISIYNKKTKMINKIKLNALPTNLIINEKSNQIFVPLKNNIINIYDINKLNLKGFLKIHKKPIIDLKIHNNLLYSCGKDNRFHIYDLEKESLVSKFKSEVFINKLEVNEFYNCLALAGIEGNFWIQDIRIKMKNKNLQIFNTNSRINFILSNKQEYFCFTKKKKGIIFDLRLKEIVLEKVFDNEFFCGTFLEDKKILVANENFEILSSKNFNRFSFLNIDKGTINTVSRHLNYVYSGGFDCLLKKYTIKS